MCVIAHKLPLEGFITITVFNSSKNKSAKKYSYYFFISQKIKSPPRLVCGHFWQDGSGHGILTCNTSLRPEHVCVRGVHGTKRGGPTFIVKDEDGDLEHRLVLSTHRAPEEHCSNRGDEQQQHDHVQRQ